MKSLSQFLQESQISLQSKIQEYDRIDEALILFPNGKPFQLAAKVEDGLRNFLRHCKKRYSFNNKQDLEKLFKDYLDYTHLTWKDVKNFGIVDGASIADLIIRNKEALEKDGWKFDNISSFDETKMQKEYKKWKNSDDYVQGKRLDKSEYDDANDEDLVRTLVVYDANDPSNPETTLEYDFEGKRGKATDHQVNMIKMDWKYETGLKYYDARPILLSNYLKKSDAELEKVSAFNDVIGKMD